MSSLISSLEQEGLAPRKIPSGLDVRRLTCLSQLYCCLRRGNRLRILVKAIEKTSLRDK